MQTHSPKEITRLLVAWGNGDESALETLTPLVYEELHRLAHHYMRNERAGHTLQSSALVNEAYVRLIDWKSVRWQSRAHFFGVSAQLMRRILVDFARSRNYAKRGGQLGVIPIDEAVVVSDNKGADIVALDEALGSLSKLDEPDGRALTYVEIHRDVANIWSQPLEDGAPRQITNFNSDQIITFDWSRDGKQLALARGVINNDVVLINNFR